MTLAGTASATKLMSGSAWPEQPAETMDFAPNDVFTAERVRRSNRVVPQVPKRSNSGSVDSTRIKRTSFSAHQMAGQDSNATPRRSLRHANTPMVSDLCV